MRYIIKSYNRLQNRRTAFYAVMPHILLIIFVFTLNVQPVLAGAYTVEDIEVDVSADNAVEAREKAFEEAQIKGYKMLAERFLSAEELEGFEAPDISIVSSYVKDFEVTKEKLSATRYAGIYKIRYSSRAFANRQVKAGQANGGEYENTTVSAQYIKPHILIMPFFEDAGYPVLWHSNPFMNAWARARANNEAAPAIVPKGDMQDISIIKDNEALSYDPQKLLILMKRYHARQAAILVAMPELMPDGTQNVTVSIYQAKSYGPELSRQISVRSHLGESREQFYNRVIAEVNKVFTTSWQRKTAVHNQEANIEMEEAPLTGPVKSMLAQVNFSSMRQWVDTKRQLEHARGVKGVSVKSLSPRYATLVINYQGGVDNLRHALQKNGVNLSDPLTSQGGVQPASAIYQISPRF